MSLAPCTRYLRDYVAIPSVNPMGRKDMPAEIAGERRYAEHLQAALRRLGLDAEVIGQGERRSVIAEARVAGAQETLLIASHIDTVPVDTMEIDPFDPQIRAGRLYGRGSCDTKGGMAALMDALERVLAAGTLRRNLIVVGEADEELGSAGVYDVLAHLGDRRPDWILATEPTELRLVTRHKGIAVARLEAQGAAAHSSDPGAGRNAIVSLSRAVLAVDALNEELARAPHPLLGPGTFSVGLTGGGQAPNIVPDQAWLVTDRRLLPGEDAALVQSQLEAALTRAGVEDVRVARCHVEKGALGTPDDAACVRLCRRLHSESALDAEPGGVAFGTDAGVFAEHGLPGLVFGPGSIEQAHTAAEYVDVAQLERAADWFRRLLEAPA